MNIAPSSNGNMLDESSLLSDEENNAAQILIEMRYHDFTEAESPHDSPSVEMPSVTTKPRKTWTEEEDEALTRCVKQLGGGYNRQEVVRCMREMGFTKTKTQCHDRFSQILDPRLDLEPFTEPEIKWVKIHLAEFTDGEVTRWTDLRDKLFAEHQRYRSTNRLKQYWKSRRHKIE